MYVYIYRTYTYLYPKDLMGADQGDDVYHEGDAAAERALEYLAMGFTAVKQDPTGPYSFQGGRELSLFELNRSEYNAKRLREAVGDRADILFGTHGQLQHHGQTSRAGATSPGSLRS